MGWDKIGNFTGPQGPAGPGNVVDNVTSTSKTDAPSVDAVRVALGTKVSLTGNETLTGRKTFNAPVLLRSTATDYGLAVVASTFLGAAHTGPVLLEIPTNGVGANNGMNHIEIRGYGYHTTQPTAGAWTLTIGGYGYVGTAGSNAYWVNPSATWVCPDGNTPDLPVRLLGAGAATVDPARHAILLGDATTVWSYGMLHVLVSLGYTSTATNGGPWTVTKLTAVPTTTEWPSQTVLAVARTASRKWVGDNHVNLTTNQTIGGSKTFTGSTSLQALAATTGAFAPTTDSVALTAKAFSATGSDAKAGDNPLALQAPDGSYAFTTRLNSATKRVALKGQNGWEVEFPSTVHVADPTVGTHAVNRSYADATYLKGNPTGDQTINGNLTIQHPPGGNAYVNICAPTASGSISGLGLSNNAGQARWIVKKSTDAESGVDLVGSSFVITACKNDGTVSGDALSIDRATRNVTIPSSLLVGLNMQVTASGSNGISLATSAGGLVGGIYLRDADHTAGKLRWAITKNSDAESTGNAGSNFRITNYSDAGAPLATCIGITRSTGIVYTKTALISRQSAPSLLSGFIEDWEVDSESRSSQSTPMLDVSGAVLAMAGELEGLRAENAALNVQVESLEARLSALEARIQGGTNG